MAANDESNYDYDQEEFFQTALEEQFSELSLNADEFHGISRIDIATPPGYEADDDHSDNEEIQLASALQNALNLMDSPVKTTTKCLAQANSSTPKRKLQFIRNHQFNVVRAFHQISEEAVESTEDQQCIREIHQHQSVACEQVASVVVLREQQFPAIAVNLTTAETEVDTSTTQLPSLSQLIRQQRRSHIFSPFSQQLKNAILLKERLQKRQQRIEVSKKAQRVSLRV